MFFIFIKTVLNVSLLKFVSLLFIYKHTHDPHTYTNTLVLLLLLFHNYYFIIRHIKYYKINVVK